METGGRVFRSLELVSCLCLYRMPRFLINNYQLRLTIKYNLNYHLGSLVEVGDLGNLSVFPKAFETVEFACLTLEDVDKEVSVVDGYPLSVL